MEPKLVKFEIKELPELCVIGKEIRVKMSELGKNNPLPAFWEKCMNESIFETIEKTLRENIYDPAYVGFMKMLNKDEFINVCGMLIKPDVKAPEGFVKYDIESCTIGMGWIQGPYPDIFMAEHILTEEAVKNAGYNYDVTKNFTFELYNSPRYTNPDENGNRILDYYMPIAKEK
ncbi:MAG: GyrI-like domain-containing protein [Spirochaetaceae bacterium]|jgi:predicted transcriptional regulator YdeE|nr:GyrI-like domain-containing protein [Spirochaetaceae bacterium]